MNPSVTSVIERLKEANEEYQERARLGAWCFMDGDSDLLADALVPLDNLRWRSVEDELPEKNDEILFTSPDFQGSGMYVWMGHLNHEDHWIACETDGYNMPIEVDVEYGPVTFWMPKPPPPIVLPESGDE